jgi:hypothetical protein
MMLRDAQQMAALSAVVRPNAASIAGAKHALVVAN